jgi:hypothetical protein
LPAYRIESTKLYVVATGAGEYEITIEVIANYGDTDDVIKTTTF